ncbi:MAG: adenylosuccinate lyase family protein [Desulfobulbaceae bacterium]|nr:adenylosuccinate lyase family protein [Desulfobulbaceae bacterium]
MSDCNFSCHIVDSGFYSSAYTTAECRKVFCDIYRYQRWLDVEVALAMAQAELGLIPVSAAENIRDNAKIGSLDLDAIRQGLKVTSHSLMPLLNALRQVCTKEAGQFIHFGATTQDIQDTAQILEIRNILTLVERDLVIIIGQVIALAEKYGNLVTIGRTHTQHALPMTMGLKMAVWLDELYRNLERFEEMKGRVLVSQLFGGVGTMDPFGDQAFALLDNFSTRLGLEAPNVAWHSSRDRITEFLSTMAMISGTLAKVADEIRCLARNEIGEMEEPFQMGKIGSSTMPHKRNPEMCEQVVVLSKLIKSNAGLGFEGLLNEHERDYRSVRLEWVTVTDTSLFTCGLLGLMKDILDDLRIHEDKVRENVNRAAPLISTEALMFFLGRSIGKQTAHTLIYETSMEAIETGKPLLDLLMIRPEINGHFSREKMQQAMLPECHVGMSQPLTQRTIDYVKARLQQRGTLQPVGAPCPLATEEGTCCKQRKNK